MWPGIFLPLMTREGSVAGPTEPGLRCLVLPCVFGPPPKPWRFTTPWKPRPLDGAVTFTNSPTLNTSTLTTSPTLYVGISAFALPGSSRRTLRIVRGAASRPAFFACPTSALLARRPRGVRSPFLLSRAVRCCPMPSCRDACPAFALSVTASTAFGSASMTVTGICCPCSLKIWVMPSFLPMMPIISENPLLSHCLHWQLDYGSDRSRESATARLFKSLDLDLDVHASRKIQLGQRVHRLRPRVEDVDHTLVRLQLELLARLLVHVRGAEHRPPLRLRRQRNRARHLRAGLLRRPHDVGRRLVDHRVIERLEPNSDSSSHMNFQETGNREPGPGSGDRSPFPVRCPSTSRA